jgi:hypothetical protein
VRSVHSILPFALALSLALPGASTATDPTYWLILRDGQRLAATGALEMTGGWVRFRVPGGTLSALPLEQVDLAATRASVSTPRQARNLALPSPEAQATSAVGLAGEAAKRAGRRGSFIDLTGIVVPPTVGLQPTPAATPALSEEPAPSKAKAPRRRGGAKARRCAPSCIGGLEDPEKLLRLRLQRLPRAPS